MVRLREPHSLAFDSPRPVNLAASSSLDATPVSFRPSQSPLVSSPGPLVAVGALAPSFRHPSRPAFGSSRCFLTFRFHLTAPEPVTRPTTLLSLAGAGVVRPRALVCTPPLSRFGRVSAPWFQAQAPGHFYISSRCAGLGARDFPQIPLLPIGHFHLTVPSPFPGLRHCFRSLCAGVVRPRALVCTPPLSRIGPSQSPLVISPGPSASLLSAGDFPRERLSNPVVRLSPHGSQDPRGLCDTFARCRPPRTQVSTLPLHLRLCRAAQPPTIGQAPDCRDVFGFSAHQR